MSSSLQIVDVTDSVDLYPSSQDAAIVQPTTTTITTPHQQIGQCVYRLSRSIYKILFACTESVQLIRQPGG